MTEREAIVALLREEQIRFAVQADEEMRFFGLSMKHGRLAGQASILRTMAAYIERGDHLIGRDVASGCAECKFRDGIRTMFEE